MSAILAVGSSVALSEHPGALITDIPPQALPEALAAYARQTHLQLVYVSGIVRKQYSPGAPAGLAPEAALTRLLADTGLRFQFLNSRCVRILAAPSRPEPQRSPAPAPAPADMAEDVVITAAHEAANHLPVSLVVWTREAMQRDRIRDVSDLADLTPGVEFDSYPDFGAGIETNIAIRGINARDGSTTAVYVDDTPVINDRASAFGRLYPVTFDLERVEVLRGPQGVLLGEGAEGGALRFVTTRPSLTDYSGFAHGEFATTARGEPSYEAGAALGGPLARELLGFHLNAWMRRDGGYVDRVDPFNGATIDADANRARRSSVSLAMTFAPVGSVSITPSFDHQTLEVHDTSAFFTYLSDPGNGILRNGKLSDQPYTDRATRWALSAAIATGGMDIAFTAAYSNRHAYAIFDDSNNSFWFWPNPMGPEYPLSYADAKPNLDWLDATALSYQLRLSSADRSAPLTWIAGAGYVHAVYNEWQSVATSQLADSGFINGISIANRNTLQLSAYAQAELRLRERLTASVGLRVERNSYDSNQLVGAIGRVPFAPDQTFLIEGSSTSVAPRASLAFQADDDNLYYLTIAKGYRAGGPNVTVGNVCEPTPLAYGPDSVWNFELGAKNRFFDGRLQTDISVFHMVWRDMQIQVAFPDCGFGYTVNAGAAVSNGFDFGTEAQLTDHLTLRITAAYADAHYTQTVYLGTQVVATDGDVVGALPLVPPPWSAVAAVEYHAPLAHEAVLSLRAQDVLHSRNPGPFTTQNPDAVVYAPERTADPATNRLDLTAALSWPRFAVSAFVTNVLDAQPTLQRRNRIPGDTLFYATTFRPRTVGLTVNWRLGAHPP